LGIDWPITFNSSIVIKLKEDCRRSGQFLSDALMASQHQAQWVVLYHVSVSASTSTNISNHLQISEQ
jgi:hypothetical protein